jgi:hypothetical protein
VQVAVLPARRWFAYAADDIEDDDEAARYVPTPADHDRMLDVLAWGRGLDDQAWRIVRLRADGYSDAAIADRAHVSFAAVARRYDDAITAVCREALGSA